jgi:hypothetical protein
MTSLSIGNSVTSIGNWAFGSCKKLHSITIPYSVTSIGDYGFWNCIGLQQITCLASTPPTITNTTFSDYSVRLVVTSNKYATANYWSNFTNVGDIVSKVLIGNIYYDIDGNTAKVVGCEESATTLIIPSEITYNSHTYSVTSIENSAFEERTGLTSVAIPNSVTSIGEFAFYYCTGLSSVTIPNSVTSIGNYAFSTCTGLTSVTIPNSITSIGMSAFSSCNRLTKVNIEDLGAWCGISFHDNYSNPTHCAHHLYIDDKELTEVNIPNSVTSIGNYTFQGCTELSSVIIPESVTSIGGSAFEDCTGLTTVTIGNSVTSIGGSAFSGCTGLTSVTIPNSVTSIGRYAFENCANIESVIFEDGESELTLGDDVFSGVKPKEIVFGRQMDFTIVPCSNLETVEFGEYVKSIADGAFSSATSLRSVTACSDVPPTIGETTFASDTYTEGNLYVKNDAINDYKATDGWKNFYNVSAYDFTTGINEVGSDNDGGAQVSVANGAICVGGDAQVRIISMNGTTVYSGRANISVNVAPGVYVVVVGNTATKVAVK